ncbi:hypothetical protein PTKIN_Ptkin15bG0067500 [Pterospermum kingtungense]
MEGASVRKIEKNCVFCATNPEKDTTYVNAAHNLGEVLAKRKIDLVYGGGSLKLMGCMSTTVAVHGKCVLGIIPSAFTVKTLLGKHVRLLKMMELSDAFIALPGSFGTLKELFQMISWARLNIYEKPIGMLNINGFFNGLLSLLIMLWNINSLHR